MSFRRRNVFHYHGELTAINEALDHATKIIEGYRGQFSKFRVNICTDSKCSLNRLRAGIGACVSDTDRHFYYQHTLPVVKAIVWKSHHLREAGAGIQLHWIPRGCVPGHQEADRLARFWQELPESFWKDRYPSLMPLPMTSRLRGEVRSIIQPFFPSGFPWDKDENGVEDGEDWYNDGYDSADDDEENDKDDNKDDDKNSYEDKDEEEDGDDHEDNDKDEDESGDRSEHPVSRDATAERLRLWLRTEWAERRSR